MARSRFVKPQADTIPISDGDTLTVRRRLNTGEERERLIRGRGPNGRIDPFLFKRSTVISYLLDWSLAFPIADPKTGDTKSFEEIAAAIDALDPDDYVEISNAIEAHADKVQAAMDAEKNGRGDSKSSLVTSSSPNGITGGSNGSENSTRSTI